MSDGRLTGSMRVLAGLLQARTGQFLAENRMWRLETSLKPLMRAQGMKNLEQLVDQLLAEDGGALADDVVDALLNNESSFYRDQHIFRTLAQDVLPNVAAGRPNKVLRIWSAGCSTGQEAYSLAMMLKKAPEQWDGWRIQILGTDISRSAIEQAKSGLYSQIDVQRGLAINDLLRWFEPKGDDWQISEEIRNMVDFRQDNLFECRVPTGEFDLIFCRNVLLYFSQEMRRQVFDRLARFSVPGALLFLGAGETVIGQTENFVASQQFRSVYERASTPVSSSDEDNAAFSCMAQRKAV